MDDCNYFPQNLSHGTRSMVFIDGENLAIRYKNLLGNSAPQSHVSYEPNVFVWTRFANTLHHTKCEVIRRYYYTCTTGDSRYIESIIDKLKNLGIEVPRVFKKQPLFVIMTETSSM